MEKIETKITCPHCKTKINVANIKYAIKYRIGKAIDEAIKNI